MSSQFKSILYRVVIFSFAILVIQHIVSWVFNSIYPEPKSMDDLDTVFLHIGIQDYLLIALLLLSAGLIAKKITDLKYWKIALALLGIILLNYHMAYVYEAIDYYWIRIRGLKPKPESDLKSMLTLISFEPTPPRYEPINHLVNWQLFFYGPFGELSLAGVFQFLFYGSVSRALWISGIVYFVFRKRRQTTQ